MSDDVLKSLERFSISKYRIAKLLGLDTSAIYQRVRRGTDWKISELQTILGFIRREHDPEFSLEDLVGTVEDHPAPEHSPQRSKVA